MDNTDPTIYSLEGNKSVNNDEADPNKETIPSNQDEKDISGGMEKKKRGRKKGKKIVPREVDTTRYSLRSSADGGGVQRSMSNGNSESQNPYQNPNNESVAGTSSQKEPVSGRKKRGRKPKSSGDKILTIRNRVRSLVTKMNYEQNLIDAYSTDGWKGQNLEKLRPEKEIERAKAEIVKCKLRIRESFKELGLLAAEGKLDNSLFDAKGEIDCEDIFCAKCGSKNVTLNNDIILCDGICDRGFHQNCLNPPLLTKDIPPGDADWLCPACDCKLDCIVLLNESKGSNLCLQDTWEKVFPEAAAAANGTSQLDPSDLPSDDSEDDDFNPDAPEDDNGEYDEGENGGEAHGEESDEEESSSDSDFYTDSSEDEKKITKKAKSQKKQVDIEALPSEDSEDDDFDPEGANSEEESSEKMANSEESDFTSDSDEFCDEIVKKSGGHEDVSTPPLDQDMGEGDAPVIGRRQREPTDYKKLYRQEDEEEGQEEAAETFGKASSESSDDEDWSEKRRKKGKAHDLSMSRSPKQSRASKINKTFGLDKTKRLKGYFETNQYPTHESKEILAEELQLTYQQVNKWFEAARRQARDTSGETSNGPRRRGRASKNSANKTVPSISGFNATPPLTPNSAMNAQKSPPPSVGTTPISATPISAVNAQKTPPVSVSTGPKEFTDSERKKAIMRELRKQKTGR